MNMIDSGLHLHGRPFNSLNNSDFNILLNFLQRYLLVMLLFQHATQKKIKENNILLFVFNFLTFDTFCILLMLLYKSP